MSKSNDLPRFYPRPLRERAIFRTSRSLRVLENRGGGHSISVDFCPLPEFLVLVTSYRNSSLPSRGRENECLLLKTKRRFCEAKPPFNCLIFNFPFTKAVLPKTPPFTVYCLPFTCLIPITHIVSTQNRIKFSHKAFSCHFISNGSN